MIRFEKDQVNTVGMPVWAAEALLAAPAGAAKLYIYGLIRESASDMEQICAETCMSEKELLEAMDALGELGLFSASANASLFSYAPAPRKKEEAGAEVYDDADYNSLLQALFSDRVLSFNDYKTFYEIRDVYGLPAPVVLMLAEHCITRHRAKNRLPMVYIREQGRSWAKEGIDTIARAEEKMAMDADAQDGVRDVLRMLGISHKNPTEEEQKLFNKWTREWGFSLGGIKAAMSATTRAQYPSMKYLDGILKELYKDGRLTARDISDHFIKTEETDDDIKELLSRLGAPRRTVTRDMRQSYARFKAMGFTMEEMKYAASLSAMKGSANFEYMSMLLAGWRTKGLIKIDDIRESLKKTEEKKAGAARMLSLAGIPREPAKRDMDTFERFKKKYGMSEDIVFFAAECAYGLSAPLKAMEKILSVWQEAGVNTLTAAKEQNRKHSEQSGRTNKRLQQFGERDYTDDELEKLIHDPLKDVVMSMEDDDFDS